MLTKRQNLIETIRGKNPDRWVNQYEAFALIGGNPYAATNPRPLPGGDPVVDPWGVTKTFPAGMPGPFPVHDEAHIVCKDITHWRDYVKAPNVKFAEAQWEPYIAQAEKVDRNEYFCTQMIVPGIFEHCHYLQEIQNCLINFYEEPEATKELIEYLTEWELSYAEEICKYIKPDALFHHDDWGSQKSSFISPEMFEEFIVPAYDAIYGYYKAHGVEVIAHHSDSYAENLVQFMPKMHIDIWQGCLDTNDLNMLIDKYGGQVTFMGGINNAYIDRADWTEESVEREARKACEKYGKKFFIPCNTVGGPASIYPGVHAALTKKIEELNRTLWHEL